MDDLERSMQLAYDAGDYRAARRLARATLIDAKSSEARGVAQDILARTEPDPFLMIVGMLGLGLSAWLVYNYVL